MSEQNEELAAKDDLARLEAENQRLTEENQRLGEQLSAGGQELAGLQEEMIRQQEQWRGQQENYQRVVAELEANLAAEQQTVYRLTVEGGLDQALLHARIAPQFMAAAKALLKASCQIEVRDGSAVVEGQPLASYIAEWAKSEHGAVFVAAPCSGGGGARGSALTSALGSNPFARESFSLTEQGKLLRENPELALRLKNVANG